MGITWIGNNSSSALEISVRKVRMKKTEGEREIYKNKITQKAAALHYKPFTLKPGKTWRLLFYRCRNFTLFLFPCLPSTRNPELNSLAAYSTLPLAGSPRLFPASPAGNALIPWTGAGEALEQLPHSLGQPTHVPDSTGIRFRGLPHSFGHRGVGNHPIAPLT